MTDGRQIGGLRASRVYGRPAPQVLAVIRALRTAPAPEDASQARALHAAASRTGRTVVEADGGLVLLGWDGDADGVWAGEGMDTVRSARPAQPRLLRALAACVRCCWPDPEAPIYPARRAKIDDVVAAAVALGSIKGAGDLGLGGLRQARGALTTLDSAGLITLSPAEGTLTLGPVIATWPERDIAVLRSAWSRLPEPPALKARQDRDRRQGEW